MPSKAVSQSLPYRRAQRHAELLADELVVQIGAIVDFAYSHDYTQLRREVVVLELLTDQLSAAVSAIEAEAAQ